MSLQVKVKKLNDNAILPAQADSGSAGMDLTATTEKLVVEGSVSYVEYGTGLALEIPEGYMGLIFPRSSISSSTTLVLANAVGVVDSSYRGEVKLRFKSLVPMGAKKYKIGERVGQLIIVPYPKIQLVEVDELNDTQRGQGGFGSSGK